MVACGEAAHIEVQTTAFSKEKNPVMKLPGAEAKALCNFADGYMHFNMDPQKLASSFELKVGLDEPFTNKEEKLKLAEPD